MGQKVPDAFELEIINSILTPALTLKLYSNDKTPANGDVAADYTEVTGGGYASKPLVFASWTITAGTPTKGTYPTQTWTFTGATGAPGSVYGVFITRNSDGKLMWADRFPSAAVPFVPENGSVLKYIPKYSVESQF